MKKLLIAIMIMSMGFGIDPLLLLGVQNDKGLHAAFSYAETDFLETKLEKDPIESWFWLNVIGVAKESLDVVCGGKFDWNDIGANNVGYLGYRLVHFTFPFDVIPWAGSEEE